MFAQNAEACEDGQGKHQDTDDTSKMQWRIAEEDAEESCGSAGGAECEVKALEGATREPGEDQEDRGDDDVNREKCDRRGECNMDMYPNWLHGRRGSLD